jgi:hypothetical protein
MHRSCGKFFSSRLWPVFRRQEMSVETAGPHRVEALMEREILQPASRLLQKIHPVG